ncbi:uncharacterized protein BROUX77_002178 [Berkeleyomyces rouxiae]|uniref:uncharacterized protein n=1 Tax=Berkeleyomyces rouxiae TaxID=2035830 RepID=UPI003B7EFD7C
MGIIKNIFKRRSSLKSNGAASSSGTSVDNVAKPSIVQPDTKALQGPPPPYNKIDTVTATTSSTPASGTNNAGTSQNAQINSGSQSPIPVASTDDDPYAFLHSFDTVFVIDDSGSMYGSNWAETERVLASITPVCTSHDADGIDLYFLNHKSGKDAPSESKGPNGFYGIKTSAEIQGIFSTVRPRGTTPTGQRLHTILTSYNRALAASQTPGKTPRAPVKPINFIIITDGRPSDDVEGVLVPAARRLDFLDAPPYQMGLQFFQVGSDAGATAGLRELDDGLEQMNVRDMVDTVSWDGGKSREGLTSDLVLKTVLGAVNRRLDRVRCDTPVRR